MSIINSFPGYEFKYIEGGNKKHNIYRGTDLGYGGYIYANPGMYTNVALLDIQSLHPNSMVAMNYFGEYTQRYKDILDTRILIKHKEYEKAKSLFDGKLEKYLNDPAQAKALSTALKIALNSCYGLTAAKFDNPMRDDRNVNNIVALRGALFMRTLQDEVESRGFTIVAIRTDSIKIADATPEIIEFCMHFAEQYGYKFEYESRYDRICQVNDAVYVARYSMDKDINGDAVGTWTATGAQFQVPYVFKKLFTREPIEFDDMCETKSVTTAIYLDMNEKLDKDQHDYKFVGKVGQFCPIKPGCGGGELLREKKDSDGNVKYDALSSSTGYRWLESEMVKDMNKEADIDRSYYDKMVDAAIYGSGVKGTKQYRPGISDFGDFEWFVSDDKKGEPIYNKDVEFPPWCTECGSESCFKCPHFSNDEYHIDCALGYDIGDVKVINKIKKEIKKEI